MSPFSVERAERNLGEFQALDSVRSEGVHAPEPIWLDRVAVTDSRQLAVLVCTYIEGEDVSTRWDTLSGATRTRMLSLLQSELSLLYGIPSHGIGALDAPSPSPTVLEWVRSVPHSDRLGLGAALNHECDSILAEVAANESFLSAIAQHRRHYCHGDLRLDNLVLTKGGQLALIDWESAKSGNRAVDAGCHFVYFEQADKRAFLRRLSVRSVRS